MLNMKRELVIEINKIITSQFPNKDLVSVNMNMDNPNDIADYGVIARYVDKELYHLYLDFEEVIIRENSEGMKIDLNGFVYHSDFGIKTCENYNVMINTLSYKIKKFFTKKGQ
jgi:hypothetical protein